MGSIAVGKRNGKLVGYSVEIKLEDHNQGRRKPTTNVIASRSLILKGLKKYSKYAISVSALTQRGKGPSRTLTVRTDENGKNIVLEKKVRRTTCSVVHQLGKIKEP